MGKRETLAGRVPQIMQMEALECGAACLAMVCAYWGKWLPLEQVRVDCGVSRDGSNALNIIRAARRYGLKARGVRCDADALRRKATFPCIAHWNANHFVVVRGFKGARAYINDPAQGELRLEIEEFDRSYSGVCLQFEPDKAFERGGSRPSVLSFARSRLQGLAPTFAALGIVTALSRIADAANPVFSQLLVDRLSSGGVASMDGWAGRFVLAMGGAAFVQTALLTCASRMRIKAMGKIAVASSSELFWHILHLPLDFFAQRSPGDLGARVDSSSVVAAQLVGVLAPLLVNAGMLAFYLVMMVDYAPVLALVGVGSILLNLVLATIVSRARINILRVRQRDEALLGSAVVAGVDMMESIKAAGAEEAYLSRLRGFADGVSSRRMEEVALDARMGSLPLAIISLSNALVLIIGAWLIGMGYLTAGALLAFQGFLARFAAPAEALVASVQALMEMRSHMERIQDVMSYPQDVAVRESESTGERYEKLRGDVRLEGVTFGYSRLDPPLLRDVSLHVKPGGSIALVGPSGCGKSTIAKLIAGLYRPWEGDVLLDGRALGDIPRPVRNGSIAVVDQDISLFAGTLDENIRLWDSSIENYEVVLAARDAELHEDIMARPGGYESAIVEGGTNLSGGQRQRVEIARALAMDPTVLVLDEATSALDAVTEKRVMDRIRRRGATLVVVAHRLSTIRDCDEIVVLDKGCVVERGTHDELIEADGPYARLVMAG